MTAVILVTPQRLEKQETHLPMSGDALPFL